MPEYRVTLHETVEYVRNIHADSAGEAMDLACEAWEHMDYPEDAHECVGRGIDAVHVEECEE